MATPHQPAPNVMSPLIPEKTVEMKMPGHVTPTILMLRKRAASYRSRTQTAIIPLFIDSSAGCCVILNQRDALPNIACDTEAHDRSKTNPRPSHGACHKSSQPASCCSSGASSCLRTASRRHGQDQNKSSVPRPEPDLKILSLHTAPMPYAQAGWRLPLHRHRATAERGRRATDAGSLRPRHVLLNDLAALSLDPTAGERARANDAERQRRNAPENTQVDLCLGRPGPQQAASTGRIV